MKLNRQSQQPHLLIKTAFHQNICTMQMTGWRARAQCVCMPKFAQRSPRGWILREPLIDGYSWSSFAGMWTSIGSANMDRSRLFKKTLHEVCFLRRCQDAAAGWEGVQITFLRKTSRNVQSLHPSWQSLLDHPRWKWAQSWAKSDKRSPWAWRCSFIASFQAAITPCSPKLYCRWLGSGGRPYKTKTSKQPSQTGYGVISWWPMTRHAAREVMFC